MKSYAESKVSSIWAQACLQFSGEIVNLLQYITGKLGHGDSVVLSRLREPSHGDVAVTDGFNLKDTSAASNKIEGGIQSLKQDKYLARLTN